MSWARWLLHMLERVLESSYSVVRGADGLETHVLVWAVPTDAGLVVHRHPYLAKGIRTWTSSQP